MEDDELAGFSVEPKRDCPHVKTHVHALPPDFVVDAALLQRGCADCGHAGENWLCLGCYSVFCSRYVNGHAAAHHDQSHHAINCSFSDLSFWCYECESYIAAPELWSLFSGLHEAKFGTAPFEEHKVIGQAALEGIQLVMIPSEDSTSSSSASSSASVVATSAAQDAWWIAELDKSVLENKKLDRILGCIYGNCLGDAVGLATEFMNKQQIQRVYGYEAVPFPDYQLNAHNRRWQRGDWTDDSDQMILIMETILELNGSLDERRYAAKLLRWINRGFPELGDVSGMGLGATTAQVVHHPEFLQNPHAAAEAAWIRLNRNAAPNGAVMRTSILGVLDHDDLDRVVANTVRIAKVTHFDSRCLASSVAATTAIAMMLQGAHDVESDEGLQQVIDKAVAHGLKVLEPRFEEEFKQHIKRDASVASLHSLELDDASKIGYTFKCVGSGFWGLCASNDFKHMINLLVREGGDADTNGAVCGALWGARYGYSALPRDWLASMPNKPWLDRKVVRFLNLLSLTDVTQTVIEKSFEELAEELDTDDEPAPQSRKKKGKTIDKHPRGPAQH